MEEMLSLLPPLVAITMAITTKRVLFSLFASIWVGGIIVAGGNPFVGVAEAFNWIVEVVTTEWNARFLILIALLGSGAAFMHKIGGSVAAATTFGKRIRSRKGAQLFTWALGLIIFFNDYVNTVIVGNTARSITEKYRISREKLSYLLDSTAAPVATMGPVSDWIGYQVSLIAAAFAALSIVETQPYTAFLASIPWNFYSILTILAIPIIILLGKDFGPMGQAENRALETGKLVADDDTPLADIEDYLGQPFAPEKARLWHFVLPLVVLIGVASWGIWYTGGGFAAASISEALEQSDVSYALLWGAFAMTVTGIVLAIHQRMPFEQCEHILLNGFKSMLPALAIMILAWSIGAACKQLGTAQFVVDLTSGWISAQMLPFIVFIVAAVIAVATGTSWGTMAILTPIVIPMAYSHMEMATTAANTDFTLVHMAIGAIFSGAILGDHCSPISDTTIMSSIFAGSDHIAHVKTQIPYALVPAGISAALFLVAPVVTNILLLLVAGIITQLLVLGYLCTRSVHSPVAATQVSEFKSSR